MAEKVLTHSAARIVTCDKIDRSAISDVLINPRLLESPDPRLRRYASSKDLIIEIAGLFATASYQGETMRVQSPSARRGLTLRLAQLNRPFVDERRVSYGSIGAKGTGISHYGLDSYVRGENDYILPQRLNPFSGYDDPIGFFGFNHAKQEMEVGDLLSERDARSSRVLAIVVLDHPQFRKWLAGLRTKSDLYPVDEMLGRVAKNGDNAAICVRFMGADKCKDYADSSEEGLFTRSKMLTRAASLLFYELQTNGEREFINRYFINRTYDIYSLLDQLRRGRFSADNLVNFGCLLTGINVHNQSVQERVSQNRYGGKMTVSIESQDCDLVGTWYDYETSLPGPGYQSRSYYNFPAPNFFAVHQP